MIVKVRVQKETTTRQEIEHIQPTSFRMFH